jgi:protoporphyrinogen oxidase
VSRSDPTLPIAILGGGCAGLAAGVRLAKRGRRVVVFEADDHVGGLAGGVHIGGNTYEYGPHIFHTTDPEILADIKSLVGAELLPYERTIRIRFLGNYFQFPLSVKDVLLKLPVPTVIHAGFSFLWHFTKGFFVRPKEETSETLLTRYYGRVLYEIFFKSYIVRVWGLSPAEFSPAFARERIPRLSLLSVLDKVWSAIKSRMGHQIRTEGYVEKVEGHLYTTHRGFSLITERMAEGLRALGGEVRLGARVKALHRDGDRVSAVDVEEGGTVRRVPCAGIVNTLPLNETVRSLTPPLPDDVLRAADALRYRALVFVGIVVRRPRVLPASFVYFREHSFNRISDLSQFGFEIKPPGSTIVVAEIACNVKDDYWKDDALAKRDVVADLLREGLVRQEEILEVHVFRSAHAYPVYSLHYETHRQTLLSALEKTANLETAGRQGRFSYINTHVAMKMGYEAADRLVAKLEVAR